MVYYFDATICSNGHVLSNNETVNDNYCAECGTKLFSKCHCCSTPIRGKQLGYDHFGYEYIKPSYCYSCSTPFPWTEKVIANAIELVALDEKLSDEVAEILKNALPDLIIETPTTPVAVAKYKKFVPKASSFVADGMRQLLIDVVSETTRKSIWGS